MCIVKVGDVIRDNDPRRPDKFVEVKFIRQIGSTVYAIYDAGRRHARIDTDRIFNDTKRRNIGWQLISQAAEIPFQEAEIPF
jgi:hypothetical protein